MGWPFLNPPKVSTISAYTLLSTSSKFFISLTYQCSRSLRRTRQLETVDFTDLLDLALLMPSGSSTFPVSLICPYPAASLTGILLPMVFTYCLIS